MKPTWIDPLGKWKSVAEIAREALKVMPAAPPKKGSA